MVEEATAGMHWLKGLDEAEPPRNLVHNILAQTIGALPSEHAVVSPRGDGWFDKIKGRLATVFAPVATPRFAMSFGMAFFALSVALSVLGVKPADLRQLSLRPAAIRHTYYNTQARVVRYYENIRFVYEVESRVREFKRNVTPAEPAPEKKDPKNDTTQQPEQKQERNYSRRDNQFILAGAPLGPSVNDLPVVSVTTCRRFV
jgi:hypothetical protein